MTAAVTLLKVIDLSQRNCEKLQLFTFVANNGARAFYEKHGFIVIGRGIEKNSGMADIRYEWIKS